MHASGKQNMLKATVSPGPHDRRERHRKMETTGAEMELRTERDCKFG